MVMTPDMNWRFLVKMVNQRVFKYLHANQVFKIE